VHGLALHVWHCLEPRISNNVTEDGHKLLKVCVHVEGVLMPEYLV